MGTIIFIAFAIVSLFLLAMLTGVLGKKNKLTKIALITLYVFATLFVSAQAFNILFEHNALLTPIFRLLMSLAAFGGATLFSYLLYFQASIVADVTKDKLKEYLKAQLERISLPSVNFSAQREKFVRMAYSLFL